MKREQAHPSEVQVGRITNAGHYDLRYSRRYRIRHELPAPIEVDVLREWATILGQAVLLIVLLGSIIGFSAILAAAQVSAPR